MKILLFNRAIGIFGKDKTSQLKSEEIDGVILQL